MKPTVGRIVHYRSYGTPGGEYSPECRAAVITEVLGLSAALQPRVSLAVLNPEGMFFNKDCGYWDSSNEVGGTWHWPEGEDSDG